MNAKNTLTSGETLTDLKAIRRSLRAMSVSSFIQHLHFFGALSIPFFSDFHGLSYTAIFVLQAWFAICLFTLEIPMGIVADRWGRKLSMIAAGVTTGLAWILFWQADGMALLVAAETVAAVGVALLTGADTALVYDLAKSGGLDTRRALARYRAWTTAGLVIGFTSGSWWAGMHAANNPAVFADVFLLTCIASVLGVLPLLIVKETGWTPSTRGAWTQGLESVRLVCAQGELRRYAAHMVTISATTFFIYWFYQPALGRSGIGISWYGAVSASFNLLGVLLLARLGLLERLFGLNKLIVGAAVAPGLMYLVLAFSQSAAVVIPAILILAALRLLREPVLTDFMNEHIDSCQRATVLSVVSMGRRLVIFIGYPIVGFLADRGLSIAFVFLGCATLLFAWLTRIRCEETDERDVESVAEGTVAGAVK